MTSHQPCVAVGLCSSGPLQLVLEVVCLHALGEVQQQLLWTEWQGLTVVLVFWALLWPLQSMLPHQTNPGPLPVCLGTRPEYCVKQMSDAPAIFAKVVVACRTVGAAPDVVDGTCRHVASHPSAICCIIPGCASAALPNAACLSSCARFEDAALDQQEQMVC
jgi:hypothetical protein